MFFDVGWPDEHISFPLLQKYGEARVARGAMMALMTSETDLCEVDDGAVLDIDSTDEVLPFSYSITAYGAHISVDELVQRINSGEIIVPRFGGRDLEMPEDVKPLQRSRVWSRQKKDRFIESLLLGLPVPEIFLIAEDNGRHLVLDGQQRLLALVDYFSGVTGGQEFKLQYVQEELKRAYQELDFDYRRRLESALIHATIVRQDDQAEGLSSIYTLFERINTGGTQLQPHEIRVALFHGPYVDLIADLNQDENWRQLYGRESVRLKDQELILRFFALFHEGRSGSPTYRPPMKQFLSEHLDHNRQLEVFGGVSLKTAFAGVTECVLRAIGPDAFKPHSRQVNAAVLDSVLIGVARRLEAGPVSNDDSVRSAYQTLVGLDDYQSATERATANEANVRARLSLATNHFAQAE